VLKDKYSVDDMTSLIDLDMINGDEEEQSPAMTPRRQG